MKVIAIVNQRGGCGKTTTAIVTSYILRDMGFRVLLVDTDAQSNSTFAYKAKRQNVLTLYDLMVNPDCNAAEAIQHTEIGDIIACESVLAHFDDNMVLDALKEDIGKDGRQDREKLLEFLRKKYLMLRNHLQTLDGMYDFIVIDTNPATTPLLMSGLAASSLAIVPVCPDTDSIEGLYDIKQRINEVSGYYNPELRLLGVLMVAYRSYDAFDRIMYDQASKTAVKNGTKLFSTSIRDARNAVRKAKASRIPLMELPLRSKKGIMEDYKKFVNEVLGMIEEKEA